MEKIHKSDFGNGFPGWKVLLCRTGLVREPQLESPEFSVCTSKTGVFRHCGPGRYKDFSRVYPKTKVGTEISLGKGTRSESGDSEPKGRHYGPQT